MGLGTDFIIRFVRNKPVRKAVTKAEEQRSVMDGRTKLMLIGLVLNSLFLFIRYALLLLSYPPNMHPTHLILLLPQRPLPYHRTPDGKIVTNQALFNWLDGAMIILAI